MIRINRFKFGRTFEYDTSGYESTSENSLQGLSDGGRFK